MSLADRLDILLGVWSGNSTSLIKLADAASGGHVEEFFKTSDESANEYMSAEVRDAVLSAMRNSNYDGVQVRAVLLVLKELAEELEKLKSKVAEQWSGRPDSEHPTSRDLAIMASVTARGHANATAPRRALLIKALAGSFSPDVFLWGQQDQLMSILVDNLIHPADIAVLEKISSFRPEDKRKLHSWLQPPHDIDSLARLAKGGLIQIIQATGSSQYVHNRFIDDHRQATAERFFLQRTALGSRILKMISAGTE
ncbi:hypothetical protein [Plesiocystis pacifica]|uniref:hypothetical protein n=1 Tax=Plesiocystis pacifica TaxID=191768 RepID=UPI0012FB90A5|nr:hypothetical protein [Plesiocystis pacifica]